VILKVEGLCKSYKTYERGSRFSDVLKNLFFRKEKLIPAIRDISFLVNEGELIGFLGPNGAGKSTTLKILTGILHPTSGKATVLGYTPWKDRKKYVGHIGAVFGQKSQLLFDIPPADAFAMNKEIYGIPDKTYQNNLTTMVDLLDVGTVMRKPTRQLSLGERMKCEFIMAMLHSPRIVFLDEPTIGLDVIAKEKIREFILQMNKSGVTFILTTHDLDDVEYLARRVLVVNHGELVFDNSMDALKKHLGTKKIIQLKTHQSNYGLEDLGITVLQRTSNFDARIELNTSQIPINNFISMINDKFDIGDISIQELPIESVIKSIYSEKTASRTGIGRI